MPKDEVITGQTAENPENGDVDLALTLTLASFLSRSWCRHSDNSLWTW